MNLLSSCTKLPVLLLLYTLMTNSSGYAQDSRQEIYANLRKSGGVNFAYPAPEKIAATPPPAGYEPVYISHFGRHGSRYLVSDEEYKKTLDVFERAGKDKMLTPLGEDVLARLRTIYSHVQGNGGQLTPLGIKQIRDIADRMFQTYPTVFTGRSTVTAVSTTVGRCIKSMELLCDELKQKNPDLSIVTDAHKRHMDYLNYHTRQAVAFRSAADTWRPNYEQFEKEHVNPDRLLSTLFLSSPKWGSDFNPRSFVFDLFDLAGNLQNTPLAISLYDLFEKEELYNLWQCKNYSLYVQYGNAVVNGGIMMENAKPLLRDIVTRADSIISAKGKGASFRFGHDGNIIPLAMLLHIQGAYNSVADPKDYRLFWNDFKIAPMAANIQMVFYRHRESNDVLVTYLYNEQPVSVPPVQTSNFPFYKWSDVRSYYQSLVGQGNNLPSSSR